MSNENSAPRVRGSKFNRASDETRGFFYSPNSLTAVLIDGGFFLKRFNSLSHSSQKHDPDYVVRGIHDLVSKHLKRINSYLYRIFFYDCKPFDGRRHNPISDRSVDFKKLPPEAPVYEFRTALHEKLRKRPKTALRLGYVKGDKWVLREDVLRKLVKGDITVDQLRPEDVSYNFRQKEVDMRIGVDIASLAINKMVQNIILVAGDGDFVPASKLARRNGICFILDPMWNPIDVALHEHIDAIHTTFRNPLLGRRAAAEENNAEL